MVQIVPQQGNIFGRLGAGFSQGLAESLPKEIERGRLAQGLQQFEQDSGNLNPMQSLARLASIPGALEHPQLIESFGQLAKHQNIRNAYGKGRKGKEDETSSYKPGDAQKSLENVDFANIPQNSINKSNAKTTGSFGKQNIEGGPQINPNNPTREEAIPKIPDSPREFDDRVAYHLEIDPTASVDTARTRAVQDMERELARPLAYQEKDNYLNKKQDEIRNEFKRQNERKLQKLDTNVYSDISGDMLNDAERKIEREIAANPNSSVNDVVNRITDDLLEFAKTKKELSVFANRDLSEKVAPGKKSQSLKKLKSFQKIYDKFDRNEEFYNYLTTNTADEGVNLTPWNGASIAYPTTWDPSLQKYINNISPSNKNNAAANSKSYAVNIEKYLNHPKASILSIAKELKEKDPYFNENYFFDQIRQDQDRLNLDTRLSKELGIAEQPLVPSWGDFWIQPEDKKIPFTLRRYHE